MKWSAADPHFQAYLDTGRPRELARVFDLVCGELVLLAGHLVRDPQLAEDLVQATFLTAIERAEHFDRSRPVVPWLTGIMVNLARAERRRRARAVQLDDAGSGELAYDDRTVDQRDTARRVLQAVDGLPAHYREVVRLHVVHGLSLHETARVLGRPYQTTKTQRRRALELLRRSLGSGLAPATVAALAGGRGMAAVRAAVLERLGAAAAVPWIGAAAARWFAAVLLAVAALSVTLAWPGEDDGVRGQLQSARAVSPAAERAGTARRPTASTPREPAVSRDASGAAPATKPRLPESGALRVRAHYESDGSPAAGILVGVRPQADASWLRESWQRTDDAGVAVFPAVPPGPLHVYGDRGGAVAASGRVESSSRRPDAGAVALPIPAGVTVQGRVRDGDRQAVAEATIWLIAAGRARDEGVPVATSDQDGAFVLRDVTPGARLTAWSVSHAAAPLCAVEDSTGATAAVTLSLPAPAGTIRGRVVGPNGEPAARASVMVGWTEPFHGLSSPPLRARADAAGEFRLPGLPLDLSLPVWIGAPGAAPWIQPLRLHPGSRVAAVTARLQRGAELSCRVLDGRGDGVAGATVEALMDSTLELGLPFHGPAWGRRAVVTDAEGAATLRHVPPGGGVLRAVHPERGRSEEETVLADRERREWRPLLAAGASIGGALRGADGAPLAGWKVHVETPLGEQRSATTDEEGVFAFDDCVRGPHSLGVRDPRSALLGNVLERRGVRPGSRLDLVVPAAADAALTGRVLDPSGAPVPTMIWLIRIDEGTETVCCRKRAAGDGTFRIAPIPSGTYDVLATGKGFGVARLGRVAVPAGGDIQLAPSCFALPGSVDLRVRADGRPVDWLRSVWLRAYDGIWGYRTPLSAGRGREPAVQPGRYYVLLPGEVYAPAYQEVEVRSGGTAVVELDLVRGVPIVLRTIGPARRGAVFEYTWRDGEGHVIARYVQDWPPDRLADPARPHVRRLALLPGSYEVGVRGRSGRETRTTFTVGEHEDGSRHVDIPLPAGN